MNRMCLSGSFRPGCLSCLRLRHCSYLWNTCKRFLLAQLLFSSSKTWPVRLTALEMIESWEDSWPHKRMKKVD